MNGNGYDESGHTDPFKEMDELSGQPSGDPGSDVKDEVMVNGNIIKSILDAVRAKIWR